jgi:hypothetical protein
MEICIFKAVSTHIMRWPEIYAYRRTYALSVQLAAVVRCKVHASGPGRFSFWH